MEDQFQFATATVAGRDHVTSGRNNQDALCVIADKHALVAVVCDGCSDGEHNEVGANVGARLVTHAIRNHLAVLLNDLAGDVTNESFWRLIRAEALTAIRSMAMSMGHSLRDTLHNHFLFTTIGALITPTWTCQFAIGDGILAMNGEVTRLGPFPGNQPPYLAYGLLKTSLDPTLLRFQTHNVTLTSDVQSLLIGTDGVADFIAVEERTLPGKTNSVGPLSQFWTDDRYFANSDGVRRRLALTNMCSVRPDWEERRLNKEPGLLPDDTTLVAVRRRKNEPKE